MGEVNYAAFNFRSMKVFFMEYVVCLLLLCLPTVVFSQIEETTLNDNSENDQVSDTRFMFSVGPQQFPTDKGVLNGHCEDQANCKDRYGYEAIRALHLQLDDDANGNIDLEESDEFLRDELQYENGYDRHQGFHGNDKYISVDELWEIWKLSEVHNWTVEETVEWLVSYVDLPQYVNTFQNHNVDGSKLPRLAVNSLNFMTIVLGIKDPIHKQKIALKAMDVVLFGPPKYHNYLKDVLLVMCLVVAIGGCWFAYVQHKYSQSHLHKMIRDMESLQNAEESLLELQRELDKAKLEQEMVAIEKENLEKKLQDEISTAKQQAYEKQELDNAKQGRVSELEGELRHAQDDLERAKNMLESKSWAPPTELQHWLQLTHELELRYYNAKKAAAEKQLIAAKEGCEKLRRKRTAFMGAFRVAHGGSIDDVDSRILQAKTSLCEITKDLQERLRRWRQIEMLCGFSIVNNPGLLYLETVLKHHSINGSVGISAYSGHSLGMKHEYSILKQYFCLLGRGSTLVRSSSEGTLIQDNPPPYAAEVSASSLPHYTPPPSYNSNQHDNSRDRTLEQRISGVLKSHPEAPSDEEAEEEEDDTDRSLTPLSSLSASGVSDKPEFTVGDSHSDNNILSDSSLIQQHASRSVVLEKQHVTQQTCVLLQSHSCQSLPNHSDSPPPIIPCDNHKKSSQLAATIRQTLSSSNMSRNHSAHSNSSTEEDIGKKEKKKKLFPHLRRKKV